MLIITPESNPYNHMTLNQYHQTKEYKEYKKQYDIFSKLGLLIPYDTQDSFDPTTVEWHPSNYKSYAELEEDREKARIIYYKTGQIPEELANKLYKAYQEELEYSENL